MRQTNFYYVVEMTTAKGKYFKFKYYGDEDAIISRFCALIDAGKWTLITVTRSADLSPLLSYQQTATRQEMRAI